MKLVWGVVVSVLALGVVAGAAALMRPPSYVPERFRTDLHRWRLLHPAYRWAEETDCFCADDLRHKRTVSEGVRKADPEYQPYAAHGDFDGDQQEDLAIGGKAPGERGTYRVLILGGASGHFLSDPVDLDTPMFFGPPRSKPHRLIIGAFGSEGASFEPLAGGGYRLAERLLLTVSRRSNLTLDWRHVRGCHLRQERESARRGSPS